MRHLLARCALILGTMGVLAGCSDLGVKPWERDVLAQDEMNLINDPIESSLNDHIYFSKEASSGGQGFAGGGCGCN
ncbi:DUF4266 domain-containing protein [Rhodanobacter aciditrophus]|uniref:DUF4266 domain-containing protein n=1 Tax=Rhodanobacter aciditrophus TaxID=1623218 RepID=A0ABW4B0S3_9GAMM